MGIRFLCPNGHRLNVKAFLAGKRGICPECDARFIIPLENGGQVALLTEETETGEQNAPASTAQTTAANVGTKSGTHVVTDVWHVRTAAGQQYGPATTSLVQTWITNGRIDNDTWVWRTGWLDWQRASDVFPQLGAQPSSLPRIGEENADRLEISLDDPFPQPVVHESESVLVNRRARRHKLDRARTVSLALGALICVLASVLAIILWQQS